jgi:hypothetical protein
MDKEKLKDLAQLKEKRQRLDVKIDNLEYQEKVEICVPRLKKQVGKCFKYHNSYGSTYEKWWLYSKILSIDEKNMSFKCIQFERTSLDKIEINLEYKSNYDGRDAFLEMGNWIEITPSEYNRAKKSLEKFILEKLSY